MPDELAVVNDELDVEALHPAAGLALAAVGLLDVAQPLAEGEIRLLDRILQERPVDLVGDRVDEGRVAFELGEAERGPERPDQRIHDVGDDVLGVIEFDAGHEVRVAGNVGDHETGRFRFRKHCGALPFHQQRRRYDSGPGTGPTLTRDNRIGERPLHSLHAAIRKTSAWRRFETSLKRLKCANTGHSRRRSERSTPYGATPVELGADNRLLH